MQRSMRVIKRDGKQEAVSFDKVLRRIQKAAGELDVQPDILAQRVLSQIFDGVKTTDLDELAAQLAASLSTQHPDYATLAAQLTISNHHKNTEYTFTEVMTILANQKSPYTNDKVRYISEDLEACALAYADEIELRIYYSRDYEFDYFGFKTLEKSYLLKDATGRVVERPQHMWMRVALGLWTSGSKTTPKQLKQAFETYDLMSQKIYTHATPTLFNAGTPRPQLSSCFLMAMSDDSIAGIYKTLGDCAAISKYAGGIGLHCHNIRARGSLIKGTNGTSNGLVPMLRVFNNTARYVDQCFTPDTRVQMTVDTIRYIKDIKEGDTVLTTGGYKKVLKAVSHWLDNVQMKAITTDKGYTVRVTDSHPILAVKRNGYTMKEAMAAVVAGIGSCKPDYIEVKDLAVGDFVVGHESWNTISAISAAPYTGPVHDFEIEAPHDYFVYDLGFAHNGGGKRNGSFAMYLEPWHADIDDFLKMKLNSGAEEERARDLFYALWIPDLFMRRVEEDGDWTLFCPHEAPGLADVYGDEFDALYSKYEKEGRGRKTVSAQKLWFKVLDSQMETGTPYLLYKDAANKKSNQKNLGTIKSSNLCTEIMEYSAPDETAVCNLASIALPAFVDAATKTFDFDKLRTVVGSVVAALNRVIDINFYPTPEAQKSNTRHRPIGLGIQGLADVFAVLRMPWESPEATRMNQLIFEHMYYAAAEASADLAMAQGAYQTFEGSPASKGQLQPDLWSTVPLTESEGTLDWAALRSKASRGMANSLLVAPMPTASTSQILGYTECFEPMTSNIYARRTLAGEFVVVNRYLMKDLMSLGVWSEAMKQKIIAQNGSVQGIKEIPDDVQALYKTAWEIKQRTLIDMAAQRGPFICQSQSLNLFMESPTYARLTSMHFYGWKQGLKTGCYYLRTKAPVMAQKFTVEPTLKQSGNSHVGGMAHRVSIDITEESESEEEEVELTPEQKKAKERAALKERLAREFEESLKEAAAAAAAGEGCTMCSS